MGSDEDHARFDRRHALGLALAGLGGLMEASAAPAADGNLEAEISAVLRRTAELWNSQEFGRLKEVWDARDPEPWYVPEEIAEPFRSWPEIENYWSPKGPRVLDAFRWRFERLRVKSLAPDLALALNPRAGTDPDKESRLERDTAVDADLPLWQKPLMNKLRKGKRNINGIEGDEVAEKWTELNFVNTYGFNWEASGTSDNVFVPFMHLEMSTGHPVHAGARPAISCPI